MKDDRQKSEDMYVPRDWVGSKAYRDLNKTAHVLLLEVWNRRGPVKIKGVWINTMDGKIKLSYKDMRKIYGFSPSTVSLGIKWLRHCGFIKVKHFGGRKNGDFSLYSLSKKYKTYSGKTKFDALNYTGNLSPAGFNAGNQRRNRKVINGRFSKP